MDFAVPMTAPRHGGGQFSMLVAAGLCAALMLLSGCSEAVIRQYTRLGKWAQPADSPTVLSGSPSADQAAFDSSEASLSEADWHILERIAPRHIWERIDDARRDYRARTGRAATRPARAATRPAAPRTPARPAARITKRPDGKLRIVYTLRHFGGSTATSTLDGGTQRRRINVKRVDLGPLVSLLTAQMAGKGTCAALPSRNAVVITCEESAREAALQLLADVDTPPRQVEIAARIFEVRHDFDFQYGARTILEHIAGDNTQRLASNFSTQGFLNSLSNPGLGDFAFQGSTMRLLQVFGNSGFMIDATFQALADTGLVKEVASPRMTVHAGRTGYMLAGQELPINSARFATDTIITEKTTYRPVGVQLYITPLTIAEDRVKLHVLTVVSSVAGFNPRMSLQGSDSVENLINPIFDSREAETSVTVPDGDTLVIGGLRMVRHITRERKVPGLGDIKWLEWLFKNQRSQRELSDLYFFVTPRIIQE